MQQEFTWHSKIKPVNPKGNQSWIFIGQTDAEAEAPIPWPPDAKNWLTGKDPDAGKDWGEVEKGATEDEMVGWHHQLNGHEFEETPGDSNRQESLVCWSPWGCKESDRTQRLNNKHCHFVLMEFESSVQPTSFLHTVNTLFIPPWGPFRSPLWYLQEHCSINSPQIASFRNWALVHHTILTAKLSNVKMNSDGNW